MQPELVTWVTYLADVWRTFGGRSPRDERPPGSGIPKGIPSPRLADVTTRPEVWRTSWRGWRPARARIPSPEPVLHDPEPVLTVNPEPRPEEVL